MIIFVIFDHFWKKKGHDPWKKWFLATTRGSWAKSTFSGWKCRPFFSKIDKNVVFTWEKKRARLLIPLFSHVRTNKISLLSSVAFFGSLFWPFFCFFLFSDLRKSISGLRNLIFGDPKSAAVRKMKKRNPFFSEMKWEKKMAYSLTLIFWFWSKSVVDCQFSLTGPLFLWKWTIFPDFETPKIDFRGPEIRKMANFKKAYLRALRNFLRPAKNG